MFRPFHTLCSRAGNRVGSRVSDARKSDGLFCVSDLIRNYREYLLRRKVNTRLSSDLSDYGHCLGIPFTDHEQQPCRPIARRI